MLRDYFEVKKGFFRKYNEPLSIEKLFGKTPQWKNQQISSGEYHNKQVYTMIYDKNFLDSKMKCSLFCTFDEILSEKELEEKIREERARVEQIRAHESKTSTKVEKTAGRILVDVAVCIPTLITGNRGNVSNSADKARNIQAELGLNSSVTQFFDEEKYRENFMQIKSSNKYATIHESSHNVDYAVCDFTPGIYQMEKICVHRGVPAGFGENVIRDNCITFKDVEYTNQYLIVEYADNNTVKQVLSALSKNHFNIVN